MQKQIFAIAIATSALLALPVACSSSSTTGTGTGGGTTDGGTGKTDSGSDVDSGGCVPVGAPGNALGVGKYCAKEADCVGLQASLCALIGGATDDFCTMGCTPADGGADPCGDNATCACQGGQCGCTPTSCQ